MIRIGVDTGGTFTDLVRFGPDGVSVHKVRSTPDDPSRAIIEGIADVAGASTGLDVVHGSTVATNAVLERKGARVALVTTAGFEDVVRIGRQTRRALYDLMQEDRRPLVDPALTFGCRERLDADGRPLIALDAGEIARVVARVRASGADRRRRLLPPRLPEPGARGAARGGPRGGGARRLGVVARAARVPRVRALEHDARQRLRDADHGRVPRRARGPPRRRSPRRHAVERRHALRRRRQGRRGAHDPLGTGRRASVGARAVAEAAGHPRVIGFDMGGTSTDVCLIDGAIPTTPTRSSATFRCGCR